MVVTINLTDASSYYTYSNETERMPIDFLKDTCTDVVVHPRTNRKKKKCVVIFHHPHIPDERSA